MAILFGSVPTTTESPSPPEVSGYLAPDSTALKGGGRRVLGSLFVGGAEVSSRWWELFQSRYLSDLVEQGIVHNADLQAAEAALRVRHSSWAAHWATFPPASY